MKDFTDNLKAFATFVVALFKSGDDENQISAGEFARAHAKKFLAVALVFVMLLAVSCGNDEKFFGGTGEEFMQRYNANLDRYISDTKYADLVDSLKVDGVRYLKVADKVPFASLQTRTNYLAMEISAQPDIVNVHWNLNDRNAAHGVAFKIMACVAAYSIDADRDSQRFDETVKAIDALFTQFDRGNLSPTITHEGITYSINAGMGDFGGTLKGESIWFTAKKSNK